jgi:hypothetical protein
VKQLLKVQTFSHSLKLPAQEKKCELFKSSSSLFVVEGFDEGDGALVGEVDGEGPEAIPASSTKNFAPKHIFIENCPNLLLLFNL